MKQHSRNDPYFGDVPWDIIYDEDGEVLGEVYLYWVPDYDRIPRRRKKRNEKICEKVRGSKCTK